MSRSLFADAVRRRSAFVAASPGMRFAGPNPAAVLAHPLCAAEQDAPGLHDFGQGLAEPADPTGSYPAESCRAEAGDVASTSPGRQDPSSRSAEAVAASRRNNPGFHWGSRLCREPCSSSPGLWYSSVQTYSCFELL